MDEWDWVRDVLPCFELKPGKMYVIDAKNGFDEDILKHKLDQLFEMGLNTKLRYCNWFYNYNIRILGNKCVLGLYIQSNGICNFGWVSDGEEEYYYRRNFDCVKLNIDMFLDSLWME